MKTARTNPSISASFSTLTPIAAVGVGVENLAEVDGFVCGVIIFFLVLSIFD